MAALGAGEANLKPTRQNVEQPGCHPTQIASARESRALRGAVRTTQLNLEYATIQAPISGLIGDAGAVRRPW